MRDDILHPAQRLLARRYGDPADLTLSRRVLRGGLEAAGTEHIVARFVDANGRRQVVSLVAKLLVGRGVREEVIYRDVLPTHDRLSTPRLLGSERLDRERVVLFLEPVRRLSAWPWRDVSMSERVLVHIAGLHATADGALELLPRWDYEDDLSASAIQTLDLLEQCRRDPELLPLARALPCTRRLVRALARLRSELLRGSLGSTLLHGDLHSGNVIVRRRGREVEPVLLDWGRARVGSPLEDVSSWLQSLGYWEPEARRRHDTLLASYLNASGHSGQLTADLRESYWLACASNVLAGALAHHLQRVQLATSEAERATAYHAASDSLRALRRADAVWS